MNLRALLASVGRLSLTVVIKPPKAFARVLRGRVVAQTDGSKWMPKRKEEPPLFYWPSERDK